MRVDIIQGKKKRTLRRISHEGETYVMAPKKGSYTLRLHNDSANRRMAVITVDGVNVVDGKDGDFAGDGYVLSPWETLDIPGWHRNDGTVAAFQFRPEKASYANQTGRGTKNVGVIGVAVFDEKEIPTIDLSGCRCPNEHHHHHYPKCYPWWPTPMYGHTIYTSSTIMPISGDASVFTVNASHEGEPAQVMTMSAVESFSTQQGQDGRVSYDRGGKSPLRGRKRGREPEKSADVGTGYGQELKFETFTTTFDRASDTPAEVICLRYATRERLESWGVPVDRMEAPTTPQAFPRSQGPSVPAPPGWRG